MKFDITQKPEYNILVSKVEKIDASNASELRDVFTQSQNNSQNKIIIDLSATKYCDSSGLSALLAGHRFCRDTNGQFIIFGVQSMVGKLISIAQLDKVLTIVDSLEKAEESLK